MRNRSKFLPAVDSLEDRLALTGGMASVAHQSPADVGALVHTGGATRSPMTTISLSGTAQGTYNFKQSNPDTGTTIHGFAKGKIDPLGATSMNGSFTVPGMMNNGEVLGTLTLHGQRGSVTLSITAPAATNSSNQNETFAYSITGGTGRFRHDQGRGTVDVTLVPATSKSGTGSLREGHGKVTLVFAGP